MARPRLSTEAPKAEPTPEQQVFPLPQEDQPHPELGWEGREPFTFVEK